MRSPSMACIRLVPPFLFFSHAIPLVVGTTACEVTFRNIGGLYAGEKAAVRVFSVSAGRDHVVHMDTAADLESLLQALSRATLRLTQPYEVGPSSIPVGSKLVGLGGKSLQTHGSDALQSQLNRLGMLTYPARLLFRPDEFVGTLEQGDMLGWNTTVGQLFEVEADEAKSTVVRIQRDGEVVFARSNGWVSTVPTGALKKMPAGLTASWAEVAAATRATCMAPFVNFPDEGAYFCSPRHDDRFYVSSRYDMPEVQIKERLVQNRRVRKQEVPQQVRSLQKFTSTGFQVRNASDAMTSELREFYKRERLSAKPELGVFENPTLSSYESDVWSMTLPADLQDLIDGYVRPLVAEWSGFDADDFATPVIHGPRLYHNGSSLNQHVDNLESHAFGVIIHVGHLGFRSGDDNDLHWPFVISDHAGVEHELPPDTVGQLVLYEAATCPHYRRGKFIGREFANIFVHYAPRDWPRAYFAARPAEAKAEAEAEADRLAPEL